MNEEVRRQLHRARLFLRALLKGILFGLVTGVIVGLAGGAFRYCVFWADSWFQSYHWLLYLLPVGGIAISLLYQYLAGDAAKGTNMVLQSVRDANCPPLRMAPLIFLSTVLTHLFGGSVGREGAALQLGGSITGSISRGLHMEEADTRVMVLCGMSAGFSSVFGTPITSAVFAMEIVNVGVMYYGALVPCCIAAIVAWQMASLFDNMYIGFPLPVMPSYSVTIIMRVLILALLCGILSALFWRALAYGSQGLSKLIVNPIMRVIAGGAALILLTCLVGTRAYNGSSTVLMAQALSGRAQWYDFLIKIVFTVLTIAAGYKGGEIVPTMVIGATFGTAVGPLLGLNPALAGAVGLTALFCGVTNAPLTSIVLSMELFGSSGLPYFALATAVSYLISGNGGLYSAQEIRSSKLAISDTIFTKKRS